MPSLKNLHALTSGSVRGVAYRLSVHDLGLIMVRSGQLEANDPFVNLGQGVVTSIPPGEYPVRVTVADVSSEQDGSHLREAYLSVVLAAGDAVRLTVDDGYVPVDAGTVGFVDAAAVASAMPPDGGTWYDGVFDNGTDRSWFALMDSPDHLREGSANIVMPLAPAGENVVLSHSGWGDGVFPVVSTYAADGRLLGIHIDLLVAGDVDATTWTRLTERLGRVFRRR